MAKSSPGGGAGGEGVMGGWTRRPAKKFVGKRQISAIRARPCEGPGHRLSSRRTVRGQTLGGQATMIIEPDELYFENGRYVWSPERRDAVWARCFQEFEAAL